MGKSSRSRFAEYLSGLTNNPLPLGRVRGLAVEISEGSFNPFA